MLLLQIPLCYANRSCALDRHKGFRYHYSLANKILFNVSQASNARSADIALSTVRLDLSTLLIRMPTIMMNIAYQANSLLLGCNQYQGLRVPKNWILGDPDLANLGVCCETVKTNRPWVICHLHVGPSSVASEVSQKTIAVQFNLHQCLIACCKTAHDISHMIQDFLDQ